MTAVWLEKSLPAERSLNMCMRGMQSDRNDFPLCHRQVKYLIISRQIMFQ